VVREHAADGFGETTADPLLPARTSASAFSMKSRAAAAAYAWKYVRARSRSMVFDHCGIFHSSVTSGLSVVFGRWMTTLLPVAFR
jgi:hypothetical protein